MSKLPYHEEPVTVQFTYGGKELPDPESADFAVDPAMKPYFAAFLRQFAEKVRFLVRNHPALIEETINCNTPNLSGLSSTSDFLEVMYFDGVDWEGYSDEKEVLIPLSYLMLPTPELHNTAGFVQRLLNKKKEVEESIRAAIVEREEQHKKIQTHRSATSSAEAKYNNAKELQLSLESKKRELQGIIDSLAAEGNPGYDEVAKMWAEDTKL